MTKQNKHFYEEMYKIGKLPPVPTGFLWKMFTLLRRFELHRTDAVLKLLPSGEKLLDVGCGCGSLMLLARQNRFQKVYGVDLSENVIKGAKNNIKKKAPKLKNIFFKVADLDGKLPFSSNFFDCVTAVAVFEHIFDPYHGAGEIRRILKKNGTFILEVPNIAWLPYRISLLSGQLPRTAFEIGWDGGHLHYFTFKSIENLLENSGFTIVKKTTSGIFSNIRNIYPSLLGANIIFKAIKK